MAKRLNPHRRLLARQAAIRQAMARFGNAEDAGKLQQGVVRSPMARSNPLRHRKHMARPHSKFGDEPPPRPVIPGSQRINRY